MNASEKRFWDKVDKSGDCWEWTGPKFIGYGKLWFNGVQSSAHRVALEVEGVDIPSGMLVCHHCDDKGCVNPDHLFIGTHKDNTADMFKKGRNKGWSLGGEHCPKAKLTEDNVREIRRIHIRRDKEYGANALAKRFGVGQRTILSVVARETWQSV